MPIDTSAEAISSKIRKLMALANNAGATAAEAAAAAAMAAELAVKFNLDLEEAAKTQPQRNKKMIKKMTEVWCSPRDRKAVLSLGYGVAQLYACVNLITWVPPRNWFSFVGQEHNAELAELWLRYLWEACQRLNKEYNRSRGAHGLSAKAQSVSDQAFRLQFASVVCNRLIEKRKQMAQTGVQQSNGTALMVVNWYDAEMKEVNAFLNSYIPTKKAKTRTQVRDHNAGRAGAQAGERVSLDTQIGASKQPNHKQLH